MTQQVIDTTTNHGTYIGDPASTAFGKINANFSEIYPLAQGALPKAGGTLTGTVRTATGGGAFIVDATSSGLTMNNSSGNIAPLRINSTQEGGSSSNSSAAAFICFYRTGLYGAYFGLDADSVWKVGGWSMGANVYNVFHSGVNLLPSADNARSLGSSALRFTQLFAATATINTSDQRYKTNIANAALGLNFVLALRPVSYTLTDAENVSSKVQTGETTHTETNEAGVEVEVKVPVFEEVLTPRAGVRTHYGLIAQEVSATLAGQGIEPSKCGIWTQDDPSDTNSRQGLRYEELIAPLIKAVQEQQALIVALTARVATLEGVGTGS